MKKPKFLQNINPRRLHHGANSTVLIVGFITAIILINAVLSALVARFPLKIDLTKERLFVLSDETKALAGALEEPVKIFYLIGTGNEDSLVEETINRYKALSGKITSEKKDPVRDPLFSKKYQEGGADVSEGSLIVESGDRFKTISQLDMFDVEYTQAGAQASGLALEAKLTGAISYVTAKTLPAAYFVTGHGEVELSFLQPKLEEQNFSVSPLDLKTSEIPEDASLLFVVAPQRDFAAGEIDKLDKYFDNGGRAFITLDPGMQLSALDQYFDEIWGVKLGNDIVFETDQRRYFQTPIYLLPAPLEHEFTEIMFTKGLSMLWPQTKTLEFTEKSGITVAALLTSGEKSLAKDSAAEIEPQMQPGDREGAFTLAAVLTQATQSGKDANILLAGTSQFLGALDEPNFANGDFFYAAVHGLSESGAPALTIKAKNLRPQLLNLNALQKVVYALLFAFLPPLLVLAFGLGIWLRRRHL